MKFKDSNEIEARRTEDDNEDSEPTEYDKMYIRFTLIKYKLYRQK
jgi:hypothetical protein